ncbi:MAG: hypothetical protein N2450_00545 [bacterium]|nr:hypothetical protein [bacterium]
MSFHNDKITQVIDPGPWKIPSKVTNLFIAIALFGAILWVIGLLTNPLRAWSAYLINFLFVYFLALSGILFTAIQYMTNAKWSPVLRRIPEGMSSFLPIAFLFLAIFWLGIPKLYDWFDGWENFHGLTSDIKRSKVTWLSQPFFSVRLLFFLAIWILLAKWIVANSIKQDNAALPHLTKFNTKLSIVFTIFFAISFSITSYDLLMSLEPNWFSTMFGVYVFSGLFQSGIAAITIIAIFARRQDALPLTIKGHIRDLGGFLFALSAFMSYIGFCQFMLIWYANLPEETFYYIKRTQEGWWFITLLLPLLKFVIPFVLLMPSQAKKNEKLLLFVSVCIILGEWIDIYWMVLPTHFSKITLPGIADIGGLLFFVGLFCYTAFSFYKKHSMVPTGDPKILTSLNWGA